MTTEGHERPRSARAAGRPGRRLAAGLAGLRYRIAVGSPVPLRTLFGRRVDGQFGILVYHRVTPMPAGVPAPTMNVTPSRFRRQLEGLLDRGYRPWPLRKALECNDTGGGGAPVPPGVFVVTFDDGYENLHRHAWPVLADLRIPATVFLATAYLDSCRPFPFDDWEPAGEPHVAAESWRPLTTDQCREMAASGLVELGVHTHTHEDFREAPAALAEDLGKSLTVMRQSFGLQEACFAFPYGRVSAGHASPVLATAARESGVLCGLTTENDLVVPPSDPFAWGRLHVGQADSSRTLAAKLDGWYGAIRDGWRHLRRPPRREEHAIEAS